MVNHRNPTYSCLRSSLVGARGQLRLAADQLCPLWNRLSALTRALVRRWGLAEDQTSPLPLLFFLVAIPWPLKRDLELTQWLQERVSSIIVDILLLMEHEARLEGTVIDVGVFGKIGVDQACSGINGLQASLVVTLFLGAYYRFGWIHRIVLALAGTLVALAFNLGRAFSLSFLKVKGKGHYLDDPPFHLLVGLPPPCMIWLAGSRPSLSLLRFYFWQEWPRAGSF